jgi:RNA polymerase sigma-70 factor (ECF subfamily)
MSRQLHYPATNRDNHEPSARWRARTPPPSRSLEVLTNAGCLSAEPAVRPRTAPSLRSRYAGLAGLPTLQSGTCCSDSDLFRRVAEGDNDAFEVVYRQHHGAAYSFALRLCGSPELADDVCQEAFCSLWRATGASYDSARGNARAWILSIVHHRAIDTLRQRAWHGRNREDTDEGLSYLTAKDADPGTIMIRRQELRGLAAAIRSLPANQQEALALAYFEGRTHAEIAAAQGVSLGTAKGRIRLGLHRVRASCRGGG